MSDDVFELRIEFHQRGAQCAVERVHRAVAFGHRLRPPVPDADFHRRLTNGFPVIAAHGDMISLRVEQRFAMFERLADEQCQRTFGGFEFVALVLQFLDAIQDRLQFRRVVCELEAEFLRLHHDVAAAREVADEDVARVADERGSMCS